MAGIDIASFSEDILRVIYLHNAKYPTGSFKARRSALTTARYTSQVCAHWRTAALGCQQLWTCIEFSQYKPQWNEELLRRSDPFPIDVTNHRCTLMFTREDHLYPKIFDRLRSFNGFSSDMLWATLVNCLLEPKAILEDLRFDVEGPPSTFFGLHKPIVRPLKRLALDTYYFDICSPVFANLLVLSLKNTQITHSDFVASLVNMPLLEELYLFDSFAPGAVAALPAKNILQVPLPCLRQIVLEAQELRCGVIVISHLAIPPSCALFFRIYKALPGLDFEILAQFFADRLCSGKPHMLGLHVHPESAFQLFNYNRDEYMKFEEARPEQPHCSLHISFEVAAPDYMPLMLTLSGLFASVTSLRLSMSDVPPAPFLLDLQKFKNLTTFRVDDPFTLNSLFLQAENSLNDHVLFPSVHTLVLIDIEFEDFSFDRLLHWARWRRSLGMGIKTIKLHYSMHYYISGWVPQEAPISLDDIRLQPFRDLDVQFQLFIVHGSHSYGEEEPDFIRLRSAW